MIRRLLLLTFLLPGLAACAFLGDTPTLEVAPPPAANLIAEGISTGIKDSHFEQPIEVTDLYRAPPSSIPQWIVCIRSAKSDEARRQTYSVFFGTTGYVQSRYSVYADDCSRQQFQPFVAPATTPPPTHASPPEKGRRKKAK